MSLLLNLAYWIPYQHSSSGTVLIYSFHLSPSWLITLLVMALFQVLSKGLLSPPPPPLIKKASVPKNDLKNYRPVSGLCFLSKLVERVVAKQLTSHININKLDNPHQSSYKPGHSTETALLSIKNEVQLSLARGEPTALVLLDLSAAFDTIDHSILLSYLKSWFGLGGTVLKWFASYLGDRCQVIKIGSTLSELSKLIYGVPQGSVLGPLLFSLYTTPLSKIIRLHPHIKFYFYADDTQLYIHLSHKNASAAIARLNACLLDVQQWMSLSKLKLNPGKTEFIVFGSKSQRQKISSYFPVSILFIQLILLEI